MSELFTKLAIAINSDNQEEIAKIIVDNDISKIAHIAMHGFLITDNNILKHMDAAKKLISIDYKDFTAALRSEFLEMKINELNDAN